MINMRFVIARGRPEICNCIDVGRGLQRILAFTGMAAANPGLIQRDRVPCEGIAEAACLRRIDTLEPGMKKTSMTVKGGVVTREAATGRVVEVRTAKNTFKATLKTRSVLEEASSRRRSALARLADR